ncbi:hypothetical protein DN406_30865 [Bacillus sp. BB56-3]|nr:hypothetical protein DN406_30865 [Bacillus sp. BB56-3]
MKLRGRFWGISAQNKQSDVRAGIPLTWHGGLWIQSEGRIHTRNRKSAYEGSEKIGKRTEAHPIFKRLESENTK